MLLKCISDNCENGKEDRRPSKFSQLAGTKQRPGGGGLSDGNIRDMLDEDSGESDLEDLTGRESGWNEDDDRNVSDMEVDDNWGGDGDLDDQNNTFVQPDNALDLTDDEDEEGEEGDERGGDEVGEDDLGPVQGEHRRVRPTFNVGKPTNIALF